MLWIVYVYGWMISHMLVSIVNRLYCYEV